MWRGLRRSGRCQAQASTLAHGEPAIPFWSWAVLNFQSRLKVTGSEWNQGTIDWTGCQVHLTGQGRGGRWLSGAATLPDLILVPPFLVLGPVGLSLRGSVPSKQTCPWRQRLTRPLRTHPACTRGWGGGHGAAPATLLCASKISAVQKTPFFLWRFGDGSQLPTPTSAHSVKERALSAVGCRGVPWRASRPSLF